MKKEVPEGPFAPFWWGVVALGAENGGNAVVGLEVLKREARAVLEKTIDLPYRYVDFENLFYRALTRAIETYDFKKGSVSTHLMWQVRDIAQREARSRGGHSSREVTFTDMESDEDDRNPVETISAPPDQYSETSQRWMRLFSGLDYMHFKNAKSLQAHSYGELIALLAEGKTHRAIAREWGVSAVTLLAAIKEVKGFISDVGVLREFGTTTGKGKRTSG